MKLIFRFLHPVVYIFLLWLIFASPYIFHGNVPFSSTYQTTFFPPWSAYSHDGMPVKNEAMPDVIGQIYPWKHLAIAIWKSGQIPLWNPYSFSGTPLLANYQSAVLSPFNVLFFLLSFIDAWSMLVLLQPLLAGLFTYLYTRSVGISKTGSVLSSIAFMFCGFITTWMGYATLGYALLFLPLGLYAIERFFQSAKKRFGVLLSFVLPLSFFSGHFQISIYVFFALLGYLVYRNSSLRAARSNLVQEMRLPQSLRFFTMTKEAMTLAVFFLLGILLCLPQLLPSLEFYTQSLRSNLFQRIEVIPWGYLPTFLAPDFFGNPITRNAWFGHYAEWNGYIGILPFFLALFGIFQWKKFIVKFWFIIGIISILLAFPSPLQDTLVGLHIPVLATSALSRIIGIYSFAFAVLAGFGWDYLVEQIKQKKIKKIIIWMGFGLFCLLILWGIVVTKVWLPLDKIAIAKQNLFLPTLVAFSGFVIVFLGFFLPKKYQLVFLSVGILCLVGFDMLRFSTKWQAFDPKQLVFSQKPITKEFASLSGYDRALGNYGAEVTNYYELPGVEGYDALYPKRYGEFIASLSDGKLQESARSVVAFPKNGTNTPQAINFLDITYIVHKLSDDNMVWAFPYWQYPSGQFVQVFQDSAYRVLKNTKAFPHAFLVSDYVVEKNNQKILDILFGKNFNSRTTVVLEGDPHVVRHPELSGHPEQSEGSSPGEATITAYSANNVQLAVKTTTTSLLFLSDTFYPGWSAYVDGKQTKIYRADYTFRAIVVPVGNHEVEFVYFPTSFVLGLIGAVIGAIGLLLVALRYKILSNKT